MSGESHFIPLISLKPFTEFSASEYREYVKGLEQEWRPLKVAPKDVLISQTKKGSWVVRVRRDPKHVLRTEIDELLVVTGLSEREMFVLLAKRKVPVV